MIYALRTDTRGARTFLHVGPLETEHLANGSVSCGPGSLHINIRLVVPLRTLTLVWPSEKSDSVSTFNYPNGM